VWGDGGYQGQTKAIREAAPQAQDMTCRRTSRVRAKVEHAFRILKRIFGFDKVKYRGIKKNHNRLCTNFALVNLYLHRKRLVQLGA
jgi:IS5 family transposase